MKKNEKKIGLKESYFDGFEYKGYSVKTKLAIEGQEDYKPMFLNTPEEVYQAFRGLRESDKERFYSILLNSKNKVIGVDMVSQGTLTESPVHPREVYKPAILSSAAGVIFVHSHPSGDPTPSKQDRELTHLLGEAGKLMGIEVLDHVIVGDGRYFSFSEFKDLISQTEEGKKRDHK